MISEITIEGIATYKNPDSPCTISPQKVNYFFGCNASGKSTLTRVIENYGNNNEFENCKIQWEKDEKLDILAFSKEFIENNFYNKNMLDGVFTLGSESREVRELIDRLNDELQETENLLERKNASWKHYLQQQDKLQIEIGTLVYKLVPRFKEKFRKVLKGNYGDKRRFFAQIDSQSNNTSELLSEEDLIKKYAIIYADKIAHIETIDDFDRNVFEILESSNLLTNIIVTSSDNRLSSLIKILKNSDWVINGLEYLNPKDKICPFCQRKIGDELYEDICNLINNDYENKMNELRNFSIVYENKINILISTIEKIMSFDYPFIDSEYLKNLLEDVNLIKKINIQNINHKIETPSQEIKIDSILVIIDKLNSYIENLNKDIEKNNNIYEEREKAEREIRNQVWLYLYSLVKNELETYHQQHSEVDLALNNIEKSIEICKLKKLDIKQKIDELYNSLTSVKPVASKMNKLLLSFGFDTFELSVVDNNKSYKIIRKDGEDAKNTLSEGERNFLIFLYFFYLVNGSHNSYTIGQDKIIIIDDPISSLDSGYLFIVSTLIKKLINMCLENKGGIKQIFLLSHNIFFFREVTFKPRGNNRQGEIYWIITRKNSISRIKDYSYNPIKSSYQLLWSEVKNAELSDKQSVYNSMRRILEYYSKNISPINIDKVVDEVDETDRLGAKTLMSLINAYSHEINDDLQIVLAPEDIEVYLNIFEKIFTVLNHKEHYEMMMKSIN